jgi:hypothetical protein
MAHGRIQKGPRVPNQWIPKRVLNRQTLIHVHGSHVTRQEMVCVSIPLYLLAISVAALNGVDKFLEGDFYVLPALNVVSFLYNGSINYIRLYRKPKPVL